MKEVKGMKNMKKSVGFSLFFTSFIRFISFTQAGSPKSEGVFAHSTACD